MKFINRATVLAVVFTLAAVSAWAQAKECTDDFKTATYSKWYDNRKDKQDVAYEAAKEYISVCTTDDQYSTALKKFIADYDKIHSNQKLVTDFDNAVKAKNYPDQIRIGKQLVAMPSHADNAVIYILMAGAGLGDANLMAESTAAARKAIELLDAGKPFAPTYPTKEQALAGMNYILAKGAAKTSPNDAIGYLVKAAKSDTKNPQFYGELADAYAGQVEKLNAQYQPHIGKPETTESKLILANLNQAIDRQIDALARAAAASTDATVKKSFMDALTEIYKFRNKSEAGINELVANVLSRPLPEPPKPITELPTPAGPAPVGTGAAPTGGAPSSAGGTGNNGPATAAPSTSAPSTTKPAPTGTAAPTTAPAKPTATPKPKPRRANHRRG